MIVKWKIVFLFLTILTNGLCLTISQGDSEVSFEQSTGNYFTLTMDENNNFGNMEPILFKYSALFVDGDIDTASVSFTQGNFDYSFNDGDFVATSTFDYEQNQISYVFSMRDSSGSEYTFYLTINNIDDEAPTLQTSSCSLDENENYDETNTECQYTLTDPDGYLNNITISIVTDTEQQYFDFNIKIDDDDIATKSTDVYLITKQALDYETSTIHVFSISVKDTHYNVAYTLSVNVNDQDDTPPIWVSWSPVQQFQEKTEYSFTIRARDGDYGIDSPIFYNATLDEHDYITIQEATEGAIVRVAPIDRDETELDEYDIEITACETKNITSCTPLEIRFYISDINDQTPVIDSISNENDTFITVTDKSISLKFDENYNQDLQFSFDILDKDTATNAVFTLTIVDDDDSVAKASEAFQLVPYSGMQTATIRVSVINSEKLDYEDEDWRNIHFTVLSTDNRNSSLTDSLSIDIELLDYFDEAPAFNSTDYEVSINETLQKDELVTIITADDKDANDVHTYTISGSHLLRMDSDGQIFVDQDNAFDYDRSTSIIVQIRAQDLGLLTDTTSLTINILDVNNKQPSISIEDVIQFDENQSIDTVLNGTIIASDLDTDAQLIASINWTTSYAVKNFRRVTSDEYNIEEIFDLRQTPVTDSTSIQIDIVIVKDIAPDYETVDTVYLTIVVEDVNTVEGERQITANVPLNIIDINDNSPVFVPLTRDITVVERTVTDTLIDVITATDADVTDTITYSIEPYDTDHDWISIENSTGRLYVNDKVDQSYGIDADTDKVYSLNYLCVAVDEANHQDEMNISIVITDLNNKIPNVYVDNNNANITENSLQDVEVTVINTEDADRDVPYHTVACYFSQDSSTPRCSDAFNINNNVLVVLNDHSVDRETYDQYTCSLVCYDNPDLEQGNERNSVNYEFTVTVLDENDNAPEITTTSLENVKETLKNNVIISRIEAEDLDIDNHAKLTFSILEVTVTDNGIIDDSFNLLSLFKVEMEDENNKFCNLLANYDLEGFYGTFSITFLVQDCVGCSEDEPVLNSSTTLTLTVERFNYYQPHFIFPDDSTELILLDTYQTINTPLVIFNISEYLTDFEASEGAVGTACTGKYTMTYQITESSPENNIFIIRTVDDCTSQLQITSNFDETEQKNQRYVMGISVKVKDGEPEEGEASYNATTTLSVVFRDRDADPYFDVTTFEFSLFEEDETKQKDLENLAKYPGDNYSGVYYSFNGDASEAEFFAVYSNNGTIYLNKALDYETQTRHQFGILASKNAGGQTTDPNSIQTVTVNVVDINDNPPYFNDKNYNGAVTVGMVNSYTVLTLEASDPDSIDTELTFSLYDITPVGNGISNVQNPFTLDSNTGELRLSFAVESTMSGYFTVNVSVSDKQDEYGFGPHETFAVLQVYIITSDDTVDFKFENTVEQVVNKQADMIECISSLISLRCGRSSINADTEDNNVTKAALYFFNETNNLIDSDTVLRLVTDIQFFYELRDTLYQNTSLMLLSFTTTTAAVNSSEELRVWLIGTSVVLGSIIAILIFVYILHTKQLKTRITKLTKPKFGSQDSGLNRIGVNAPNTNVHAVEGTNPVFNTEVKSNHFDQQSISSGDSGDLVGIEDNPEFDMFNNNIKRDSIDDDYI